MDTRTTDMQSVYQRYTELAAKEKAIAKEKSELRSLILDHLCGQRALNELGFSVKLNSATRRTPQENLINEVFGITLTDECFKTTTYDTLSVNIIKA